MSALAAGRRSASIGQSKAASVELVGCWHRAADGAFRLRALQTGHDEDRKGEGEDWVRMGSDEG